MTQRDIGLKKAALFYASQYGLKIFPVVQWAKRPAITGWQKEATSDPERVASWWEKNPLFNIGVALGEASGLDVVDIDVHHGGEYSLNDLIADHGKLPVTPAANTPHRGTHLYFRHPSGFLLKNNNSGALGAGIDFKTSGGYTVLPPSRLDDDGTVLDYTWDVNPPIPGEADGAEFAPLPAWIVDRLIGAGKSAKAEKKGAVPADVPERVPEGGRNDFLARVAGSLRRKGLQEAEILAALRETNRIRCVPPLPEEEVAVIARSIGRYPAEDPITVRQQPAAAEGTNSKGSLHHTIERLATLSHVEYDRVRKPEAERLGVNVTALDADVRAARNRAQQRNIVGSSVEPRTVEPWPEPVDGAELLEALAERFRRHVIISDHDAVALALWVLYTHAFEAANFSPLLLLTSPTKRCGKSTVLGIIERIAVKPLRASNITPAALFRCVEAWKPTLILDEADCFMKGNEELRGIVNSGHTKMSAKVIRVEGEKHELRCFSTWCPKAIAGIDKQAGTIHDRSIEIKMRRRRPDEMISELRDRTDVAEFEALACKCARWASDFMEGLQVAKTVGPPELNDRQKDNWEPLLAIADLAGGEWSARARSAALALSGVEETDEDNSVRVLLLADIRQIFDELQTDRVTSATLIERLGEIQEHPWATFEYGKLINPRSLAKLLKGFDICSRNIRTNEGKTPKGFLRTDFQDAFDRYLARTDEGKSDPLHPLHDLYLKSSVADKSATVADLWRQENETNSFNKYCVADKEIKRGGEYKEKVISGSEGLREARAATYRGHVKECLFCAIENGEVVELCPDGKALFDEYLKTRETCRMA